MTSVFAMEHSNLSEKFKMAVVVCEKWPIGRFS
jgi:hypothetical protein